MPELPEVETIARSLRPLLVGKRIMEAKVRWARTIATPSPSNFEKRIQGQIIEHVGRRAKFLDLRLTDLHLLIHLRMSGDLQVLEGRVHPSKHDRLVVVLAEPSPRSPIGSTNGEPSITSLVFNDTRKFGRVWLTEDSEQVTGGLGPEPLSRNFTVGVLHRMLRSRRRQLKPLLLDQTFLAGLGNIYTDEALHMARLHPLKSSHAVNRPQAERLHRAIQRTLREGIRRNGASIDWVYRGGEFQNHFRVYDREGQPCPACGTAIRRLTVGQRGTHICPRCQRI